MRENYFHFLCAHQMYIHKNRLPNQQQLRLQSHVNNIQEVKDKHRRNFFERFTFQLVRFISGKKRKNVFCRRLVSPSTNVVNFFLVLPFERCSNWFASRNECNCVNSSNLPEDLCTRSERKFADNVIFCGWNALVFVSKRYNSLGFFSSKK